METRLILRSMFRKWWIFLIVLLITVGATMFLTLRETPVYRSKATYITRLSGDITDAKTASTLLDSLNRYAEIHGTYSEIAMSTMIKRKAGERLDLQRSDMRTLSVSSRTLPGSKVLEITVQGTDPKLIHDFAGAVGEETMAYVNALYPAYELALLDPASTPDAPISPKIPFNLTVGILLGVFLGAVAGLLASWLRGDFKNLPAIQSNQVQASALQPVKNELELLLQHCESIRTELNETRELIHSTESEARTLRNALNNWPKNGNSHREGKKKAAHLEEHNETDNVEHESSTE